MESLLTGAAAGFAATLPMTVVMRSLHRALPQEDFPLPPEQITARLSEMAGLEADEEAPGWEWKTYAAHLAYGAGVGALYSLAKGRSEERRQAATAGALFGLAVWGASYLGWLPATGILPAATKQPLSRNVVMIAAHLVWGSTTGLIVNRLREAKPCLDVMKNAVRSRPARRATSCKNGANTL